MTVYLCGASGSENGGITGYAGDQTGKEVRKTKWYQYSPKWTYVIRATDKAKAEKIALAAEQGAANNHIGYDQGNRNDLLTKLLKYGTMKAIAVNTECDCTSFAACCMIQAGFPKSKLYSGGNLPYSKNFDTKALSCGGCTRLSESRYLVNSDYLERGDILVCYGHHAEVVVSNGAKTMRNAWQYDGKHWCYLDSSSKMVRSKWVADSKGWCWLGSNGYWVEGTRWLHIADNWYHITKGYRDHSRWVKDSKGWCYVGSDGKMVVNKWVKDARGWCWVGSDGRWVTGTKWLKADGTWYHITNGYQDRNSWHRDSHGWCYVGSDGKWVKGQWVDYGKHRYYVKPDGYMATGTVSVDGKEYEFDDSGRLVSQ